MLADYNAVDVSLNITIDNQAWYPDLGNVAKTNHNRLANIMTSQGYTVVSSYLHAWKIASHTLHPTLMYPCTSS